jgi:hypothetical protein
MVNHMVAASADGRFFACAAFTAEVKIWEMTWGKAAGDPVRAVKVMHLQVSWESNRATLSCLVSNACVCSPSG